MPIIVTCTGCGRKLRLAEQHAGKQARCPMCRMTFPVPTDAATAPGGSDDILAIGPDDSGTTPTSASPQNFGLQPGMHLGAAPGPASRGPGASPADAWYLRTPEGHQYGPVPKSEMDAWVKEGRVTAQCQLRLGDAPWQPAGAVYSFLGSTPAVSQQPMMGQPMQPANPFSQPQGAPYNPNPYAAPMAPMMPAMGYPGYGYQKPHRGGLILGLGIASYIICCPILNVIALSLAFNDLSEMDRGTMDPNGRGLTRAGQILAGVQIVLGIVVLLLAMVAGALDF